jgi:hypothetical protein
MVIRVRRGKGQKDRLWAAAHMVTYVKWDGRTWTQQAAGTGNKPADDLSLVICANPIALLESAFGRGATIIVEAKKK